MLYLACTKTAILCNSNYPTITTFINIVSIAVIIFISVRITISTYLVNLKNCSTECDFYGEFVSVLLM